MHRRIRVLYHWMSQRKKNVSFFQTMEHLLGSSMEKKAKQRIKSIEKANDFLKVFFQGFDSPLYWPEEMSLRFLYMVTTEVFDRRDWHQYEFEGTHVEPGDVLADCGSAEGLFSFVHRKKCQKIYFIEPLPRFVQSLKLTFAGQSNTEILPFALSSTPGFAKITADGISSKIETTLHETGIRVTTLDDLFFKRKIPVSFIKADLEGYDYELIKGGENLIAANLPKIAITTYHHRDHAALISHHLKTIHPGYKTKTKGIYAPDGSPVMLHAWVEEKNR